ncbi:Serine/threonine-protein phosphatase 6 regulatory subunit [Entamoeba marina]
MKFWSGMFSFSQVQSNIDTILQKDNCTVDELLNDEEFTSEIRTNTDLIVFIEKAENMGLIVEYAIGEFNTEDLTIETQQKFQQICFSLFTNDPIKSIEVVAVNESLLKIIFQALCSDVRIKRERASEMLAVLVQVEDSLVFNNIIENDCYFDRLMDYTIQGNLDTIMELLKIDESNDLKFLKWLEHKDFITHVLNSLIHHESIDVVENINRFIHDIVYWKISTASTSALQFIYSLNNNPTLITFVDTVFQSTDDYYIQECFYIFSNIVACSTVMSYPEIQDDLPGIFKALIPHLPEFVKKFETPKVGMIVNNLVYVILSLVLSGFPQVYTALCDTNIFESIIELFYGDHLCTIARQTIQTTLTSVFTGDTTTLKLKVLNNGEFLSKMVVMDKAAIEIKKQNNLAPDYFLISASLMKMLYNLVDIENHDDDPVTSLIYKNEMFFDYVENVVIPRDQQPSEFFFYLNKDESDDSFEEDSREFCDDSYDDDEDGLGVDDLDDDDDYDDYDDEIIHKPIDDVDNS